MNECTRLATSHQNKTTVSRKANGLFGVLEASAEPKCPAAWGIYGMWLGNETKVADINLVQCWSKLLESEADVKFSLTDWRLESLSVQENTISLLGNGSKSHADLVLVFGSYFSRSRNLKVQAQFTNLLPSFDGPFSSFLRTQTPRVFNTDLLRRDNFDQLKAQIKGVCGLVVAQTLNFRGRNTTALIPDKDRILNGTVTYHVLRLQQNCISTRILQGLLA